MKTVIICGMGESKSLIPYLIQTNPEALVYTLNTHVVDGATHHFEMHCPMKNNVSKTNAKKLVVHPFYEVEDLFQDLLDQDADFLSFEKFPLERVFDDFKFMFYNSTACYMIAHAVFRGAKKIFLAGIDFVTDRELAKREAVGMATWVEIVREMGVVVEVPNGSMVNDVYNRISRSEFYCYGLEDATEVNKKRFENVVKEYNLCNANPIIKRKNIMKYFYTDNATNPVKGEGRTFAFQPIGYFAGQMHGVIAVDDGNLEQFNRILKGRPLDEISRKDYDKSLKNSKYAKDNGITPIADPESYSIAPKEESKTETESAEDEVTDEENDNAEVGTDDPEPESTKAEEPEVKKPEPAKKKPVAKKKAARGATVAKKKGVVIDGADPKAKAKLEDDKVMSAEDAINLGKVDNGAKAESVD